MKRPIVGPLKLQISPTLSSLSKLNLLVVEKDKAGINLTCSVVTMSKCLINPVYTWFDFSIGFEQISCQNRS